jgi:uncharacterized protein with GYD domain
MATYVTLSRFSPGAFDDPKELTKAGGEGVEHGSRRNAQQFQWKQNYATLGRFDVVDIVESDDTKPGREGGMIIRAHGHSTTETLIATPWTEFLAMLR